VASQRMASRPMLQGLSVWGPACYLTLLALAVLYLHPHPLPPVWPAFVVFLAASLFGTYVFSCFVFAHVRRQEAEIVRQTRELADANEAMAVIRERQRIAHELHDHLAQNVGYLHLRLAELERRAAADGGVRLEAELSELKNVARDAYEDARQAIFGLRSMVSRSLGIIPTLTEYLHEWSRQTAISAELRVAHQDAVKVPPVVEVQLIGIIMEALSNVRKHAHARRVLVAVEHLDNTARVAIEDDGVGFDPDGVVDGARTSFGIDTMMERAEAVGGRLTVRSHPGQGTRVEVELPATDLVERQP